MGLLSPLYRGTVRVPMRILKKSVSKHFESFYKDIVARIGVPKFCPTATPGRGDCRLENGVVIVRLRTDLNKSSFEQHAAHELLHALQLVEGWPRIVSSLPDESPIVELGIMLQSIVLDLSVEERAKQMGFDSTQNMDAQYQNLNKAVLNENIPPSGNLRYRKAAMMYAYASLTQPQRRWNKLKELFLKRAPHIARRGEQLASILRRHGWDDPDQALASMLAVRENIGLPADQLGIFDRRTGRRF